MGRNATAASSTSLRNWLIGVGVVATLGIVLILMQRFGAIDWPILRGAAGGHTTSSTGSALKPSGSGDQTAALIDSLKREVDAAKHTTPVKPAATKEVSEPAHEKATEPAPPPKAVEKPAEKPAADAQSTDTMPDTGTFFGIGVASYLDIDKAREEKDKFVQSTTLPGDVVPYEDDGSTMYRVVLGKWATAGDAERASTALMERGLITEAHVVTIPKK